MHRDTTPNETVTVLCGEKLKLLQEQNTYRFSLDPILLANFAHLKKRERMLDIGTGCGIIPIYMALRYPENSLMGIEIQKELFDLAVRNLGLNKAANVRFLQGDVRSLAKTLPAPFDVVISNPPYVKHHTGRASPQQSRYVARYESRLDLESLCAISGSLLYTKGRLYVIYPAKRLGEFISIARSQGLEPHRLRLVHPRKDEPANLFLIQCVKGGGTELKVERPLYIYEDGDYTKEIKAYYA